MSKQLRDYWEIGEAWGKIFKGKFQIENGQVVHTNYCSSGSPPLITATYKVLPLKQCPGAMKVSFKHKRQEYNGVVDLFDHWYDSEIKRVKLGRLEATHLQPVVFAT